jgi:hypothetical protein
MNEWVTSQGKLQKAGENPLALGFPSGELFRQLDEAAEFEFVKSRPAADDEL